MQSIVSLPVKAVFPEQNFCADVLQRIETNRRLNTLKENLFIVLGMDSFLDDWSGGGENNLSGLCFVSLKARGSQCNPVSVLLLVLLSSE